MLMASLSQQAKKIEHELCDHQKTTKEKVDDWLSKCDEESLGTLSNVSCFLYFKIK